MTFDDSSTLAEARFLSQTGTLLHRITPLHGVLPSKQNALISSILNRRIHVGYCDRDRHEDPFFNIDGQVALLYLLWHGPLIWLCPALYDAALLKSVPDPTPPPPKEENRNSTLELLQMLPGFHALTPPQQSDLSQLPSQSLRRLSDARPAA